MTRAASVTSLESLTDDELLSNVQRLTARANIALADLLTHLGEVEFRGIHRTRACASLYTYCIYELRMSEDAAYRRAKAARLVREHPDLRDAIAKGEIHLTGVLMIGPHLGGERHTEILRRARFRSKREIARLVAELDPRPGVPPLVEPLGPELPGTATQRAFAEALAGPVRVLPMGERPEDWIEEGAVDDADAAVARPSEPVDTAEPARPLRYKVQFTASQEFVDLLDEARDLLGHEHPRPDLPDVQLRALRALVKELRGRKRAETAHPRGLEDARRRHADRSEASDAAPARVAPAAPGAASVRGESVASGAAPARDESAASGVAPARSGDRHVPAVVRRGVWARDGARCAYVDGRGERCRETCALEIHHRRAYALGGPTTLDNLELRCRAHNVLAAEEDFGRERMDWVRTVQTMSTL